jgi:hypothetical protein
LPPLLSKRRYLKTFASASRSASGIASGRRVEVMRGLTIAVFKTSFTLAHSKAA